MLDNVLFNKTNIPTLLKSLDAGMLRSRVIGNNIANVNTPGYQRLEVSFEDELRTALNKTRLRGTKTSEGHMDIGRKDISKLNPKVEKPIDYSLPSGVNNVDIDNEMAKLAENQILFNFSSNMIRGAVRKINSAIQARSIPIQ
jgi:flagellar basal-body rod protein FlgB